MKQKLLSILALLLMAVTGAWAQGSGGDDWGPVQTSTPESTNPGGTYTITYYAPYGITPSKTSEDYTFGSDTEITLPTFKGGGYKWMLSTYGRALGETTSHCAGPNGDIYEPGTEVNLSNIYGDIEFCPVYVGCEIDCASWYSSYAGLAYSSEMSGKYTVVNLKGRKLYKDGYWNTLTLPFSLDAEKLATTCLAGADIDIRRFKEAFWDAGNERLTINFSDSNEGKIDAGVPYIIRWGEPGNATGEVINNPSFTNVSIAIYNQGDLDETEDQETADMYETEDKGLRFQAQIAPVQVDANSNTLLLGGENKLYKPNKSMCVYATRAYFTYTGSIAMARELVMDFGEGEQTTTYIDNIMVEDNRESQVEGIFNLNGQRLDAPQKGINIINGKKVVIK